MDACNGIEMFIHLFRWDIAVILQKLSEWTDIIWKTFCVVLGFPSEGSGSRSVRRHLYDNGVIVDVYNSWDSSTALLSEMC